jgi:hypothetical protein
METLISLLAALATTGAMSGVMERLILPGDLWSTSLHDVQCHRLDRAMPAAGFVQAVKRSPPSQTSI